MTFGKLEIQLQKTTIEYSVVLLNHLITVLASEAFLVFEVNRLGCITFTFYTKNILCMWSKTNAHIL